MNFKKEETELYPLNKSDLYHIKKDNDEKSITPEFLEMRR